MIDLVPEKDFGRFLPEFHRVLKPDGRAVISTMALGPASPAGELARIFPAQFLFGQIGVLKENICPFPALTEFFTKSKIESTYIAWLQQ